MGAIFSSIAAQSCLAADPKTKDVSLSQLSLEVSALQTLHRFQMTSEQLAALKKLTVETVPRNDTRMDGKGSEKVRKALADLRAALIQKDDEKILDLEDLLSDTLGKEEADLDDHLRITPAAKKRAVELLHNLKPHQVAAFYASQIEELPDPDEELLGVLDIVGKLKDDQWKEVAENLADEISWQLGGSDSVRSRLVRERVDQYLKKVRSLNAKDLAAQRGELEKMVRQFISQFPSTAILHNYAEHHLAEMLSNPRLSAALEVYP